jgi:branched-chain amino acid transport system permease protein
MTSDAQPLRRPIVLAGVAVLVLLPIVVRNAFFLHVLVVIGINVTMAVSLWLLGTTGLISFGQAGFMFVGAMTSTLLAKQLGWPVWLAFPLAGVVPAALSVPVGALSIRVKGVYFFLVTLAFGEVVRGIFAYFQNPFGGWYGIRSIPGPEPARWFTELDKVPYYYFGLALTLFTCLAVGRITTSRIGMVLRTIQEGDVLAESVGIAVFRYKLLAFVLSSFFAGLAGSYYAHYFHYISPLVFTFQYSLNVLMFVVIGGMARVSGPIIGAVLLTLIPEMFRVTGKYQMLIFGVVLVFSMLFLPEGVIGLVRRRAGGPPGRAVEATHDAERTVRA